MQKCIFSLGLQFGRCRNVHFSRVFSKDLKGKGQNHLFCEITTLSTETLDIVAFFTSGRVHLDFDPNYGLSQILSRTLDLPDSRLK